jgi:phage baseplate assembly protein W
MAINSELGRSIKEIKNFGEWKAKTNFSERKPIGIKTPLEKGKQKGETLFKMHFDIVDQIKDNLKNLIMTQKGERLGFPDYGTSLRTIYSNTSLTEDQIAEFASQEIKNSVEKFMPNIALVEFYSNEVDANNISSGKDFLDAQSSISIKGVSNINTSNKKSPSLNKLYKITINFNIPLLGSENNSIVLFINNAV